MLRSVTKGLVFIHRWMGILLSIVMLMWCLSGFVMMYVAYPSLGESARLAALRPLDGQPPTVRDIAPASKVGAFQIEMVGERPVAWIDGAGPSPTQAQLLAVAKGFDARATYMDKVERDQWTVSGDVAGRPFARYALNDGKGTWLYVSTKTGRAAQKVSASQRVLAWLGPIPHWIYPKALRQNPQAWSQTVMWLSGAGTFMTVVGIAVGLLRLKKGKISPYKGWHLWHHLSGLVFGLLVLTWVFSGLLSMDPGGMLSVKDDGEAEKLAGLPTTWAEADLAISRALAIPTATGAVSLRSAAFDSSLFVIATMKDGRQVRLGRDGHPAPFSEHDRLRVGSLLGGTAEVLAREDAYYFSHGAEHIRLPVIRVITPNRTRYYVNAHSGALISKVDKGGRRSRWWFEGLHRLDFFGWLRWRPVWDGVMILLLAGTSTVCATGLWVGVRHLRTLAARRRRKV